jgi:hypothetical protein
MGMLINGTARMMGEDGLIRGEVKMPLGRNGGLK